MTSQSSATSPEIGGHKHVPLTELRAAGKHGSFVVQVKENMIEDYTYRRNGMETAGKRLVLLFASADEAAYVSGRMVMWKQDRQEITAAAARFQKGLHFEMSSVVLLQKEQPEYIHTPLKAMIDVRQTTFKPILQGQYPAFLVAPPTTLRDILQLGDGRQRFDLTTLVRLEGQVRSVTTQQGPRMAQDLRLRDGSVLDNGDQALVTTTIFTTTAQRIQRCPKDTVQHKRHHSLPFASAIPLVAKALVSSTCKENMPLRKNHFPVGLFVSHAGVPAISSEAKCEAPL